LILASEEVQSSPEIVKSEIVVAPIRHKIAQSDMSEG